MNAPVPHLSRISKIFVDRDQTSAEAALVRRQEHKIAIMCGADVAGSYTLQLAVLTAASIASRVFPGAVRIGLPKALADAPLLVWPSLGLTFGRGLAEVSGPGILADVDGWGATQLIPRRIAPSRIFVGARLFEPFERVAGREINRRRHGAKRGVLGHAVCGRDRLRSSGVVHVLLSALKPKATRTAPS